MIEPYMPDLFRSMCDASIELRTGHGRGGRGGIRKLVIVKSPMHAPNRKIEIVISRRGVEFFEEEEEERKHGR